jgi:hypothetical protein
MFKDRMPRCSIRSWPDARGAGAGDRRRVDAANQKEGYFKLPEPGSIEVLRDGRTRFVPPANGMRRYPIADVAQKERVSKAYAELASTKPSAPGGDSVFSFSRLPRRDR